MTPYQQRREEGHYDVGAVKTTRQDTVHDPETGGTTVQESPAPAPAPEPEVELDPDSTTIAELRDQAEARGLPTYGTKAQIAERIANHDNES